MKNFKIRKLLMIFVFLSAMQDLYSQVLTRSSSVNQGIENFVHTPVSKDIIYHLQPDIDFEGILEEDRRKDSPIHRAAVKVDQNYNLKDGTWSQYGEIMIWQIGFSAPKARSLNFLFSNIELPEGAEMYVFSKDGKIIHGPVLPKLIYDKVYATDIIESTDVVILVKTNVKNARALSLTINGVCQGVKKTAELRAFGDSDNCNFDVNCSQGNGWQNERDAVAVVVINGIADFSGVLINNECQDLRPFFLTAFHNIDANNDQQLSTAEQDLSLFVFRFKYEAGTPTCPGNSTGTQGIWITYSGATFRAASVTTDFALFELNGSIANQPNISLAGWNRNTTQPTQTVTAIHHPFGDAKKISRDNEALITTNPNMWIVERWDVGLVERGSSGSPLFDANGRIIGQLKSGDGNVGCNLTTGESFTDNNRYGRFNLSWTGGGTNATRLSNWLGGSNPSMTLNSIRSPSVNINGSNSVCTTNKSFTLSDPIPGKSVTWSVSNPSLFATSGGATTSGTGTTATLRAASAGATGSANLTFTLTQSGCNPVTIVQEIWVGRPGLPITSPSGTVPIELGVSAYHTVYLSSAPGATAFIADWSVTGAISRVGVNIPATYSTHVGDYVGTGNWQVMTSNTCGTNSNFGQYNVTTNCNPCPRVIVNNPVRDVLIVQIPEYVIPVSRRKDYQNSSGIFTLMNQSGGIVKKENLTGLKQTLNVADLKTGMYFLRIKMNDLDIIEKVVVIR